MNDTPSRATFAPWATAIYAVLWAVLMVETSSALLLSDPITRLYDPAGLVARVTTRDLQVAAGAEALSPFFRRWWESAYGTRTEIRDHAELLHREVADYLADPMLAEGPLLRSALLRASAGEVPEPALADFGAPCDPNQSENWDRLEDFAPWLAGGLRAGCPEASPERVSARAELAASRHRSVRAPLLASLALVLLGGVALARGALGGPASEGLGAPPWSLALGLGVLVRGDFWNRLYYLFLTELPADWASAASVDWLYEWGSLFASLPLAWLAYRHLYLPHREACPAPFGLRAVAQPWQGLAGVALAAVALDLVGAYGISWSAWALGAESHWSEGLDETLIFGHAMQAWRSAADYVLWAPLFEELTFRGVLYFSLRRVLGPLGAGLASAGIFGAVHFYGPSGFAVTLWSGLVWAFAYERSRSLLPGVVAHALYNALWALGLVSLYR